VNIALIGDYDKSVTAHRAIPMAITLAASELDARIDYQWIDSENLANESLSDYSAVWCVPASPYKNTKNILQAIKFARLENIPFLGTCGGYQHAVLEFARNVLNYPEADNAEITPETKLPLIATLQCQLYDEKAKIKLEENSILASIYGSCEIEEEYFCGYGVNVEYLSLFNESDLAFTGYDASGDPRCVEISVHRFFIGTAFQPERSALTGVSHPLIRSFIQSSIEAD